MIDTSLPNADQRFRYPAATGVVTQGHGDSVALLKGAAAGLGSKAAPMVLGAQQLGAQDLAAEVEKALRDPRLR